MKSEAKAAPDLGAECAERYWGVHADAFSGAEKELIQRVIRARRDVRKFKSDPIPPAVLARILEAAHAAPSVGFSQPWDFILIDSPEVRRRVRDNFEEVNRREKQKLGALAEDARLDLYSSLKLEGILESPLNIAVTCNHRPEGGFVLGRATMPETAPYSVCLAIQNLWLAARAEGVGVGWVSILDREPVADILGLPEGVELIAYLCVGYPEEFRARPMLEEVGWKERERLERHLFRNRWGTPAAVPAAARADRETPDSAIGFTARAFDKMNRKTKPVGSLGVLETLAIRLAGIQRTLEPEVSRKRICVYAGTHGIAAAGVSAYPSEVTGQMVLNYLHGGAAINVLARHAGIQVHIVDAGVDMDWPPGTDRPHHFYPRGIRRGTRSFLEEPAMTADECERALQIGREQVALAVADGIDAVGIGEMGIGNTTSASVLLAALLGLSPEEVVGRGTGVDDAGLRRKTEVVSEALRRYHPGAASAPSAGRYWLEMAGGYEIAAMTGTILAAAEARLPLVVDGFIAAAAAAAAFAIDPASRDICFFSHQSAEQGHGTVLRALQAEPLLHLNMRLGEGTGAALALPLLEAAAKILCEMATFDSAGISGAVEKS